MNDGRLEGPLSWRSSGWLLDFNFLGFYMNYNKEAKSLTFRRGSEVSQALFTVARFLPGRA